MRERIVARYVDGRVSKGFSHDFVPTREWFHLADRETREAHVVQLADLKAIFFVKSFDSDGRLRARDDIERFGLGPKLKVRFSDGEELIGFSASYRPEQRTFTLYPGDPDCNHTRVVVISAAAESVERL